MYAMNRGTSPAQVPTSSSRIQEDSRVIQALESYMQEINAGRLPDRQEFLKAHAAIAEERSACLDGLELVQSLAQRLHPPADAKVPATILGRGSDPTPSARPPTDGPTRVNSSSPDTRSRSAQRPVQAGGPPDEPIPLVLGSSRPRKLPIAPSTPEGTSSANSSTSSPSSVILAPRRIIRPRVQRIVPVTPG